MSFADDIRIEAATYEPAAPTPRLWLAWRVPPGVRTDDLTVAVHLLDAAGAIVGQADHPFGALGADGSLRRSVALPAASGAVRIGIALYRPPVRLLGVRAAASDWDGHRGIIDLP
jgi:hypothetical protein